MNSTEQRNHKTVREDLDAQARVTADALEAVAERCDTLDRTTSVLATRISDERTHRLQLAIEQRGYVDACDSEIKGYVQRHIERGFWSRFNWLFTGR